MQLERHFPLQRLVFSQEWNPSHEAGSSAQHECKLEQR
jgi:hypothetical protein